MAKFPIPHKYVEIPSLEEIADMEKQRQDAIDSLEMSADGSLVKCQKCGSLFPVIKKSDAMTSSNSCRIARLRAMIKQSEKVARLGSCKNERQELANLLKQEEKMNVIRRLPFCSSKITGYRWYCSSCYNQAEQSVIINKKKVS